MAVRDGGCAFVPDGGWLRMVNEVIRPWPFGAGGRAGGSGAGGAAGFAPTVSHCGPLR
ncbi:hypothetical protein BSIN_2879 [Burkholderia singularis]|uniref:Uncharacterized protein n=1 Tax=Burkholderia singularis TaxID=1503053 RepID=A0A238H344_9BURK|nr:hypothetical protein BSIN_2879 [Burkholderia singularis]